MEKSNKVVDDFGPELEDVTGYIEVLNEFHAEVERRHEAEYAVVLRTEPVESDQQSQSELPLYELGLGRQLCFIPLLLYHFLYIFT